MAFSRFFSRAEQTVLGDGNCAFNAFSLGFCDEITAIEQHVERQGQTPDQLFDGFIKQASVAFNIKKSNWQVLRENLFHLYHRDQHQFQRKMAPIMRSLAVGLAAKDPRQIKQTKPQLLSAFHDYRLKKQDQKEYGVQDDIFSRHPFILRQFEQLVMEPPEQAEAKLWQWWSEGSGHQQFLDEMRRGGVWAGDLELSKLARYFQVNLDVWREGFMHHIYYDFGSMPIKWFTKEQVKQLVSRSIVEAPEAGASSLKLFQLSELEIEALLQEITGAERLMNYILMRPVLKNTKVPAQFEGLMEQLKKRNLVEKRGDTYFFVLSHEDAIDRMSAVKNHKEVLACWRKSYVAAPTIVLQHESEVHWSHYKQPVALRAEHGLSLWVSSYQYASGIVGYLMAIYYTISAASPMRAVIAALPQANVSRLLMNAARVQKTPMISADCAASESGELGVAAKSTGSDETCVESTVMPCRIL